VIFIAVFRNILSTNRTPEDGLPDRDGGHCPGFSLKGTWLREGNYGGPQVRGDPVEQLPFHSWTGLNSK
jgi:hypothetical protein